MSGDKIVRRTLADGSVKTYRYARKKRGPALERSFAALMLEYRQSPEFGRLAASTRRTYLRAMDHMRDLDRVKIEAVRRRHVTRLRDRHRAAPQIANQIVAVMSVLMNYAVAMEYRTDNPAYKVPFFDSTPYRRWSDDEIALACRVLPERFRRAIIVALYTGQRQGDCLAMRWSDYDGEGIAVVQQKTGERLWIACHAALRAELAAWKADGRDSTTILADSRGRPWRADSFATNFGAAMREHLALRGLVFHGLRKTAAAKLAEAGCSTHEIAAITGHRTLAMLQHYTREAEQKGRASAAILRLENFQAGKTGKTPTNRLDSKGS